MEAIELTETNKAAVLELFSKSIDAEGFIIEKKTGKRIVCPFSNENIKSEDFSIIPGSAMFVNNYYYCFTEYLAYRR